MFYKCGRCIQTSNRLKKQLRFLLSESQPLKYNLVSGNTVTEMARASSLKLEMYDCCVGKQQIHGLNTFLMCSVGQTSGSRKERKGGMRH